MYSIASLHEFRRHLQLKETDTSADTDLRLALEKASQLIESLTGRRYCPSLETHSLTIDAANPRELILPDDLLELISINAERQILSKDALRRVPSRPDLPASVLILNEGEVFNWRSEHHRNLGLARPLDPRLAQKRRSHRGHRPSSRRHLDTCR